MQAYHPLTAPDPATWRALPEAARLALVAACQRQAGVTATLPDTHTMLHVRIEDAIAAGPATAASRTAARLMAEGLDRHDAIHALATVLLDKPDADQDAGLAHLSASAWRNQKAT